MLKKVGDRALLLLGKSMVFGALSFSLLLGSFFSLRKRLKDEKIKGAEDVRIRDVRTERKRKDHRSR